MRCGRTMAATVIAWPILQFVRAIACRCRGEDSRVEEVEAKQMLLVKMSFQEAT